MADFLNPSEVLKRLRLRKNMIAADFGAGSGFWVIPLAKRLEDGKVYAIDILQEPLSALRARVKLEKISNIQTMLANIEKGTDLPERSCDLVLMTNLLFQCQDREKVLAEGRRILKKNGKILVIDWKKDAILGPKENRVLPEEIKEKAVGLGLKLEDEFDASPFHYGIILIS